MQSLACLGPVKFGSLFDSCTLVLISNFSNLRKNRIPVDQIDRSHLALYIKTFEKNIDSKQTSNEKTTMY